MRSPDYREESGEEDRDMVRFVVELALFLADGVFKGLRSGDVSRWRALVLPSRIRIRDIGRKG